MLACMRKGGRRAVTTLLVAAVLMAAQPWMSALVPMLRSAIDADALGPMVICTAHGAALLPDASAGGGEAPAHDPASLPEPAQKKVPDCPYCALGSGGGCGGEVAKIAVALAASQQAPALAKARDAAGPRDAALRPRPLLRLVTSPPRAPPHHA